MAEKTFDEQWLESAEQHSAPLEDISKVTVVDPSTPSGSTVLMSLPGVEFDRDPSVYPSSAQPVRFVQFHLSSLIDLYQTLNRVVTAATQDAQAATQAANTATEGAETVDAALTGLTVTITNRNGVSRSVDIGFEIYATYGSVDGMKADAANVPQGKFVVIATQDPTSPDNAKLYCRTSAPASDTQNAFRLLSDLDQASSAAWADWLNNYKPTIEADHTRAEQDHNTAVADHSTAGSDHTRAEQDHTDATNATAAANTQANRAKAYNDHPWEIRQDGFIWVWNEATQTMVRTNKMLIDFTELTPEQRQSMIDEFYQTLTYASVAESEAAAGELT